MMKKISLLPIPTDLPNEAYATLPSCLCEMPIPREQDPCSEHAPFLYFMGKTIFCKKSVRFSIFSRFEISCHVFSMSFVVRTLFVYLR